MYAGDLRPMSYPNRAACCQQPSLFSPYKNNVHPNGHLTVVPSRNCGLRVVTLSENSYNMWTRVARTNNSLN